MGTHGDSGARRTIAQFARAYGIDAGRVMKAARKALSLPAGRARDPNYLLDPAEQRLLIDALGLTPLQTAAPAPAEPEPAPAPEPPPILHDDPPSPAAALFFRPGPRPLHVHADVVGAVERNGRFRKRLSLVLQHLTAHGRTAQVKHCADPINRGWRRTPFGGNHGMQFYLWWAPRGSRPVEALGGPDDGIFVRALRHHDDHAPLDPAALDDYLPFAPQDTEDEGYVDRPWTAPQLDFVGAADPVRFVLGRPGSGKTTVLWKAIEARAGQRVLYLTWSRALTRLAGERFAAFAPRDTEVHTVDVVSLLSVLIGHDVERRPLDTSRRLFFEALGPGFDVGGWRGYEGGLYAEVRAMLVGRAVPDQPGVLIERGLARLEDEAYVEARAGEIGRSMAATAAGALSTLSAADRAAIFPELVAATTAVQRLRDDRLPEGLTDIDRVVVDEVQDLTLLDAAVVVELCRAIARRRGYGPCLLMAGDDGQTVRPSGFDWGRLADRVSAGLARPKKFQLEENLRCPARIAAVVQRASDIYRSLDKGHRPTKQARAGAGQHSEAFIFHVDGPSVDEAIALIEQLDEVEEVVLLSPQARRPSWLPPHLRDMVRTPAEVKGLEYQSVVVLDPGRFMLGTRPELREMGHGPSEHAVRTRIDQFRVALSRATETLAFVDVDASEEARAMSRALLDRPVPCDPDDLLQHFTDGDVAPEDRVQSRMDEARALVDEVPRRAWRRVVQAVRLLGDPALPNGVASPDLRRAAQETRLAIGARLLIDGLPDGVSRDEVELGMHRSLVALGSEPFDWAYGALQAWSDDPQASPVDMLDSLVSMHRVGGRWLIDAMVPVHQRLRQQLEALVERPAEAGVMVADVEAWLRVIGHQGDVPAKARALRHTAVETLLVSDELEAADEVAACVEPLGRALQARLHEAHGRYIDAGELYERLDAPADAYRCYRAAAHWERALETGVAPDGAEAAADLVWLFEVEDLLRARPADLTDRLNDTERRRLASLLAAAGSHLVDG